MDVKLGAAHLKDLQPCADRALRLMQRAEANALDGSAQVSCVLPVDTDVPDTEDDHRAEQEQVDLVDGQ